MPKGIKIEPEEKSQTDTCAECCVRNRDFSKKTVYKCGFCERWFCDEHIDARTVFIKDWKLIECNPEVKALYNTEIQREDGHPDFAYTKMKFIELNIEKKERNKLTRQALDKMNKQFKHKNPTSFLKKKLKRLRHRKL